MKSEQSDRVKAYLAEIVEVGKRHGLALSHEDGHGAFVVIDRTENSRTYDDWLSQAFDETADRPPP